MVEFPPLNCKDDLPAWIARVEEDLMTGGIPRSQWADAAILYLAGYEPLNMSMRKQRARRLEAGGLLDLWNWEEFQEWLSQVLGKVPIWYRPRLCILIDSSSRGKRFGGPISQTT